MQRVFMAAVLFVLCCAGCATLKERSADVRLLEAQKAYEEGERLKEAGQYKEAVPHIESALELREAALGSVHLEVASCLALLGEMQRLQGRYAHAEPLYERALAIREGALGKDHPDVASSLHNLANIYSTQGQHGRAEPLYERALAIREGALGKNHPDVAKSLNSLANLYSKQGQYGRAEPLYERALAIREGALGKNHPDVAKLLHNLALLYSNQGQYGRAEPLLERALVIMEGALGENHPDVAKLLHNLANLYSKQGQYGRAEPLYERALAIMEGALGKNHPDVASLLQNLANLYSDQGQYGRAEPLYERALAIKEGALGKNHPDVASSLHNLAILYRDQGQYGRAEPLLERALAIREGALGENHPDVAQSLNNLANLYSDQGQYGRAESLYERALAIKEGALGKNHPDVASSLINLANLYSDQGQYGRAEPLLERALAIMEGALGKNHPNVAKSLYNLAILYSDQGQYGRAEPLYERALAIREGALGKNHPDVAQSLHNLAQLRFARRHHIAESLPLIERAFTASEQHLRQEVFGFSESRLASVLNLLRAEEERLYALVRAHPDQDRVHRLALIAALLRKSRSAEEIAATSRIIYRSLGPEDRKAFERLRSLRTQRSTLSLVGPGQLSSADYQQRLKELADQGDALEVQLARRSAPLRALHALPPPAELLERVAAALPRDGALIEFVAYNNAPLVPKPGTPPSQKPSELRYLAFLLFADGRTSAIDLGPAAPIDSAALRLRDSLASGNVAYLHEAQAFYELVFRRLVPRLGKARRLFLSPDGQLALIPFAALHDGRRFLLDSFDITYLTSGKDLLRRPEDSASAHSVVVLADPDFGATPAASSLSREVAPVFAERSAYFERFFSVLNSELRDNPLQRLPESRKEAEAIKRLFPQAQLLLDSKATKEALLKLETPGLLHIATHAYFQEEGAAPAATRAEEASALVAARKVGHSGAIVDAGPNRSPDPLLRSALVLAGGNAQAVQAGSYRREDSVVTALELAGLDLWGTQLVVLSACDTGRGDVKPGQGVYGLRRALAVAGAEMVVTSLWPVNDETTRELMEGYYGNLRAGQGRAEALRGAMKALRQKKPHPQAWAPFIAVGQDAPLRGLAPLTAERPAPEARLSTLKESPPAHGMFVRSRVFFE